MTDTLFLLRPSTSICLGALPSSPLYIYLSWCSSFFAPLRLFVFVLCLPSHRHCVHLIICLRQYKTEWISIPERESRPCQETWQTTSFLSFAFFSCCSCFVYRLSILTFLLSTFLCLLCLVHFFFCFFFFFLLLLLLLL